MADSKLTEEQAAYLVTVLRSDQTLDAKAQYVNAIKSGIKQHNVPDLCIPQLFDGLRAASSSQHAAIVNVGFTALNHLLTRLSRQDPKILAKQAPLTLPLIIEKLGDQKDKLRATANQSLNTLYSVASLDVERAIRNSAMTGKNPRAKEAAMQWLLTTHQEQGLQFKPYVPILMELLEDADGMVRDTAKITVIELFKNAPGAAKSDLKRQLKNFKVRPAIEQAIVKALAPPGGRPETPADSLPVTRPVHALSTSSVPAERPITPAPEKAENVEPQYVNTNRELDDIFKGMAWFFEGRESEQNWIKREEGMVTLRRLIAGNTASEFHDTFLAGLRAMLDGIIKCINSLRTSLSKEGCSLVQDMAIAFGPDMDPMVELLMQALLKLSGGTKKIASQQANTTIDTILSNVTYNHRIMQHMWAACQDKNVQPRTYASGWIKTLLKKEANHKSHIEHTGGCELIEKCIKKGLGDANPAVREKMRGTYWAFYGMWQQRANAIMEDLDSTAQKLLNKDPNNPNSPKKGEAPRPGMGLSKSTMSVNKPSIREHMLAQKKAAALAVKNKLPARPTSAMAHISPVRKVSDPKEPPSKPTGSRTRPEAGTISVNASGMSVAPVRPRRRPEMAPRPATAGPYSVRDAPPLEADSPSTLKKNPASALKAKETTPRRPTAPRPRPGHAPHASESSIPSPQTGRSKSLATAHAQESTIPSPTASRSKSFASPRMSTPKLKSSQTIHLGSSQVKPGEEPTWADPATASLQTLSIQDTEHTEDELHKPPAEAPAPSLVIQVPEITLNSRPETPPAPIKVFEDPFVENQPTPKLTITTPVLEDKPVNEQTIGLKSAIVLTSATEVTESPEKARQNSRLLDSGIAKIKTKSLEVHGFRKLQSLLRGNGLIFCDGKFEALLIGLFQFLEDPLLAMPTDKAQDVKAQILATIKLLLKKERDNFRPHVSRCLESLLQTRSAYDNRAHIVSGLELLADDLVTLGDPSEIVVVLGKHLQICTDTTTSGCRALSMGLHVLRAVLEKRDTNYPDDKIDLHSSELEQLATLAGRCLESADSGVRMDAVQLCVAMHASVGESRFWEALRDVRDDPKSLIMYYIVKKQREGDVAV